MYRILNYNLETWKNSNQRLGTGANGSGTKETRQIVVVVDR